MHASDRIPGFAICARCGARRSLGACAACGLLLCGDCRGHGECSVCHAERRAAARRAERREWLHELAWRAAVVGLVAASVATVLAVAVLPKTTMCGSMLIRGTPADRSVVAEVGSARPMSSVHGWSAPLTFRCYSGSHGSTCCMLVSN